MLNYQRVPTKVWIFFGCSWGERNGNHGYEPHHLGYILWNKVVSCRFNETKYTNKPWDVPGIITDHHKKGTSTSCISIIYIINNNKLAKTNTNTLFEGVLTLPYNMATSIRNFTSKKSMHRFQTLVPRHHHLDYHLPHSLRCWILPQFLARIWATEATEATEAGSRWKRRDTWPIGWQARKNPTQHQHTHTHASYVYIYIYILYIHIHIHIHTYTYKYTYD